MQAMEIVTERNVHKTEKACRKDQEHEMSYYLKFSVHIKQPRK